MDTEIADDVAEDTAEGSADHDKARIGPGRREVGELGSHNASPPRATSDRAHAGEDPGASAATLPNSRSALRGKGYGAEATGPGGERAQAHVSRGRHEYYA